MIKKNFVFYKNGEEYEEHSPGATASGILNGLAEALDHIHQFEGAEARLTYKDGSGYVVRFVEELKEHDIPVKIKIKAKTADEARDVVRSMIDGIQGARVIG